MRRPLHTDELRKYIRSLVMEYDSNTRDVDRVPVTQAQRWSVRHAMQSVISDDVLRRQILGWLFLSVDVLGNVAVPELSTSKLTDSQVYTLKRWIGLRLVGVDWVVCDDFKQEIEWVSWEVQKQAERQRKSIEQTEQVKEFVSSFDPDDVRITEIVSDSVFDPDDEGEEVFLL